MAEVLDVDRSNRQELERLYDSAIAYFTELPRVRKDELQTNIPDFEENLKKNLASVRKMDCAILVAGNNS